VICGANFSVDDDVISDKDSVEDKEVSIISELNTGEMLYTLCQGR
jgi:hypothetical protein